MADGDHVAAPNEQVGLAEGDAPVHHLSRAGDDEQRLAILFELGPLMGLEGILDGESCRPNSPEPSAEDPGWARAGRSRPHARACATTPRPSRWASRPRAGRRVSGRGDDAGILGLNRDELERVRHVHITRSVGVQCRSIECRLMQKPLVAVRQDGCPSPEGPHGVKDGSPLPWAYVRSPASSAISLRREQQKLPSSTFETRCKAATARHALLAGRYCRPGGARRRRTKRRHIKKSMR